jgi:uncharacterized protein
MAAFRPVRVPGRSWYELGVQQKNVESAPLAAALPAELLEILVCPQSKAALVYIHARDASDPAGGDFLLCPTSRLKYRIEAGVPVMLVDEAEELSADAVDRLIRQRGH